MANEVKQEVNIQAVVSGEDQVKELGSSIADLYNQLNKIKDIDGYIIDPNGLKITKDYISDIGTQVSTLYNKGLLSDSELNTALDYVKQLNEQISIIEKSSLINKIASGGGMSLLANDVKGTNQQLETTEQWLNRLNKALENMPDLSDKLANGEIISDEEIDKLVEAGNAIPVIEENIKDAGEGAKNAFDGASNSTIDLNQLLLQLGQQAGLTNSSVTGLLKTIGASAPEMLAVGASVTAFILILKHLAKAYDEVTGFAKDAALNIGKFVEKLGLGSVDIFIDSLETIGDAFGGLVDLTDETIDKLQEFADIGSDIQSAYFRIYQYLGETAGKDVIDYTNNLSNLFNLDGTALLKGMKGILAVTSQLGQDTAGVTKYSKALQQLSLDLAAFSGESIESIGQQFENAINMGVLNTRSAIAKALDLTDTDIKQFKELNTEIERTNFLLLKGEGISGTYAAYMDTAAGKVMQLKNAYSNLMNTVGQLALAIWATVAPVLTKIVNLINWALQGLAKFLGVDLSSAFSNGAIGQVGKYADNVGKIGDNLEKTAKQAEKASKKVASFDDVIQINNDKTKNGGSLGDVIGDIDSYDPSGWLDKLGKAADDDAFSIDKLKEKIQELLDDFKKWEEAINWDEWRQKASDFGKTLAELGNIIVDDEKAWQDLGDLIGNSMNVALEFLNSFAKEFHFEQLGKDIAVAFKEMFEQLDEDLAAETIYNWLIGVLDLGIGFFKERPLTKAADSISNIIIGLIDKLSTFDSTTKINEFIDNLFDDVLGAINTSLDNFDNNNTSEKFANIIKNIFINIGQHTPEIIETVSRYLQFLLDAIGQSISGAIDGFFTGIESEEGGTDKIVNALIGLVDSVFENAGLIGEALNKHKGTIIEIIQKFLNEAVNNSEEWGKQLEPLVDTLVSILKSLDWSKIRGTISEILENSDFGSLVNAWSDTLLQLAWTHISIKIKEIFGSIGKDLQDAGQQIGQLMWALGMEFFLVTLPKIKEGISKELSKWKEGFDKFLNGFVSGIINIKNNIVSTLTSLWSSIKSIFTGIKNTISSIIEGIKAIVKAGINFIIDKLNALSFDIPDWLSNVPLVGGMAGKHFGFNIPRLAIGGIVDKPTTAVIGEDGTEAVVPLQKNTEWMDVLATKLAAQLNNKETTSTGTVNIELSKKNFYTRSEMLDFAEQVVTALRVYGINVSVAY